MRRGLAFEFASATEAAAVAAAEWNGRGDKEAADQAAVDAMRARLNSVAMDGNITIGEGEIDDAPMLYIGESVGTGEPGVPAVDIAVDPLEGTTNAAKGRPDAIAVLAATERGGLLQAPDMYMNKIAVGPGSRGAIDIQQSTAKNIENVASALDKPVDDVTVFILDKSRHTDEGELVDQVRETGARTKLIDDGDIAGALYTGFHDADIDLMMGTGGAPEGVIAAAGLSCLGGELQAELVPKTEEEIKRAHKMGIENVEKPLRMDDLVSEDAIFAATGVTDGALLDGVTFGSEKTLTNTVVMRSSTNTVRFVETRYDHFEPIVRG